MKVDFVPLMLFLRRLALSAPADLEAASAADLLDAFVRRGDETAFAALMSRYGPMVLRVCRRILGDPDAAEDAFQATFLVFAKRAGSVRRPACLVGWLHGVARRIALKARAARARGPALENAGGAPDLPSLRPDPLTQLTARELLSTLDEEIENLPEAYRLPILLCCLEGKTQEEAARQLGWTAGSVKGRLERGRARLHGRLVRRGLSLSTALAALTLPDDVAALPAERLLATVQAAGALAAGQGVPGTVPSGATTLMKGALRATFWTRSKLAGALLLAVSLLAAGGALVGSGALGGAKAPARAQGAPPPGAQGPGGGQVAANAQGEAVKQLEGHGKGVTALAFVPQGGKLASGGLDGLVLVWDLGTGTRAVTFKGHKRPVFAVAVAADGKTIASAGAGGIIRVWRSDSGEEVRRPRGHDKAVAALAFTPDGTLLASGGYDGTIRLWDVATGEEAQRLTGHEGRVTGLAFCGDGKRLLSGGTASAELRVGRTRTWTGAADRMRLWDVTARKELRTFGLRGSTVALSADGKIALGCGLQPDVRTKGGGPAVDGFDQISRVNPDNGGTVFTARWRGATLALAPSGKWLATGAGHYLHLRDFGVVAHNGANANHLDNRLRLWDAESGTERACLAEEQASVLAFSADSRLLAAGMSDGTIRLWTVEALLRGGEMK
jgi:RNA polymerase sigma factor (sigma-70 family)